MAGGGGVCVADSGVVVRVLPAVPKEGSERRIAKCEPIMISFSKCSSCITSSLPGENVSSCHPDSREIGQPRRRKKGQISQALVSGTSFLADHHTCR